MPILNWLTRDDDIRKAARVPYRLLEEDPGLSAGDGGAGNMLIPAYSPKSDRSGCVRLKAL